MKPAASLWKCTIVTAREAEEAVSELVARVLRQPVSVYLDAEKTEALVSVYLRRRESLSLARRRELGAGLRALAQLGLAPAPARIRIHRLAAQDWAESWKRHFHPLEIGSTLLIRPSWSKRKPTRDQQVVVLDPGLSFGTGQHPTTRFCLREIAAFRRRGRAQAFLDIGTGSGILAISAVKLGYAPVAAIDLDPASIRVARANAARNRVAHGLELRGQDLLRWPIRASRKYDLICANLMYDLLLAGQRRILNRLRPRGLLILAGILRTQFPALREAYEAAGLKLADHQAEGEWESGAFIRSR